MSAQSNPAGGQAPSENSAVGTSTKYSAGQTRSSVAGRRRVPRPRLDLDIQATHNVRCEELSYRYIRDTLRNQPDINKPLPPLPDQKPLSRPASPIDRAAHWVNKKVVTPVKEFFRTPEVEEMIKQNQEGYINEPHPFFAELRSQSVTPKHSRGRSSIDRRGTSSRRSGSISSISSRETLQSTPTTPRSRMSDVSMTSSVRHALDSAQQVGSRLGLNHEAGRLFFADAAPAGMMDPCSVCHKEPRSILYHGRCRGCR
ncbi:hypothetical protein KCU91_g11051, partial [Aureobasidium melanogenum]